MAKFRAHRVETKDITASWNENPFQEVREANIDENNHMINGVCVFGRRESANGYTYQDTAIASLARMANGAKWFLDHPSKDEQKARDGVRSVKDWAGVFVNPRRDGEKVFADLKVRPTYWDLAYDVATMRPVGLGNSINSRVKVFKDHLGKESVVDIDALKSIDLVASAATTTTLFESTPETTPEEDTRDEHDLMMDVYREMILAKTEGLFKDMIRNREVEKQVREIQWSASDLIGEILRDKDKDFGTKKAEISSILEDLDSEIADVLRDAGEEPDEEEEDEEEAKSEPEDDKTKEDEDMEWNNVTLEVLAKERPDLIDNIKASLEDSERVKQIEDERDQLQVQLDEIQKTMDSLKAEAGKKDETLAKLQADFDAAKKQLDEYQAKEKKEAKVALIREKVEAAKLPKDAVTEVWYNDLLCKEVDAIEAAVKDRADLWFKGAKRSTGDEFDPSKIKDVKESGGAADPKIEEAKAAFVKKVK